MRIEARFDARQAEYGFGFPIYEDAEHLYIVTARHLVGTENAVASEVWVHMRDETEPYTATVYRVHPSLDFALLRFRKRSAIRWEYRRSVRHAAIGDRVWLEGRHGTWHSQTVEATGRVRRSDYEVIIADFTQATVGVSGAPLLAVRGGDVREHGMIVGMVTEDEGTWIRAIPIQRIRAAVARWLEVDPGPTRDLPVVMPAVTAALSRPIDRSVLTGGAGVVGVFGLESGTAVQLYLAPHVGFRLAVGYGAVRSRTDTDYLPDYRFRNRYLSAELGASYYPLSHLRMMVPLVRGSLGWTWADPQIYREAEGWSSVAGTAGSNTGGAFGRLALGFKFEVARRWQVAFEMAFAYFDIPTMSTYILDLDKDDESGDFLFRVGLSLGRSISPSESRVRFLR